MDVTPAAPLVIGTVPATAGGRLCGRVLSVTNGQTAAIAYAIAITSVCSKLRLKGKNGVKTSCEFCICDVLCNRETANIGLFFSSLER